MLTWTVSAPPVGCSRSKAGRGGDHAHNGVGTATLHFPLNTSNVSAEFITSNDRINRLMMPCEQCMEGRGEERQGGVVSKRMWEGREGEKGGGEERESEGEREGERGIKGKRDGR